MPSFRSMWFLIIRYGLHRINNYWVDRWKIRTHGRGSQDLLCHWQPCKRPYFRIPSQVRTTNNSGSVLCTFWRFWFWYVSTWTWTGRGEYISFGWSCRCGFDLPVRSNTGCDFNHDLWSNGARPEWPVCFGKHISFTFSFLTLGKLFESRHGCLIKHMWSI